ncbi:CDGSH iron-sulfur domain-containing protein [Pleurocapsales cyanobacterium LEGE 10410]|nr:CDGSH iron-sulfur domain-containing protein [Pleurocapsales cyanobacterium LEGE 10410]
MSDVTIQVKDNGPFLVQGDVSIVDAEGQEFAANGKAIALCRCGASTNQPFCTGNHKEIGFESVPRASGD